MKSNFNRLNDLFVGGMEAKKATGADVMKKVENTKQRTFKISNEYWDDFLILAQARKQTQAELINELIKNTVLENQEKIRKCKEIF